jgi:hypothetical protein
MVRIRLLLLLLLQLLLFCFHYLLRSCVEELLERLVQKGGVKSLLILLTKSIDIDAQRFSALALGNSASARKLIVRLLVRDLVHGTYNCSFLSL